MMAGLAFCWLDGAAFKDSVRFAQGCSSLALASVFTNNPDLSSENVNALMEREHV